MLISREGPTGCMSLHGKSRTNEELRTFLGCYLLNSAWVMFWKSCFLFPRWLIEPSCHVFFRRRIDSWIKFSPWIEECLQTLDKNSEDPNDRLASSMVKLQIMMEQIHQSPWHHRSEELGSNIPIRFLVSSFRENLQQFRLNLPLGQENNGKFNLKFLIEINGFWFMATISVSDYALPHSGVIRLWSWPFKVYYNLSI